MAFDDTNLRSVVSNDLRVCAQLLSAGHEDGAPLRKLQKQLQVHIASPENQLITTIAFILDLWIADYYFNFAGDVVTPVWQEVDAIQSSLLKKDVSDALLHLSETIMSEEQNPTSAFERLVTSYLKAREQANSEVNNSEWCP